MVPYVHLCVLYAAQEQLQTAVFSCCASPQEYEARPPAATLGSVCNTNTIAMACPRLQRLQLYVGTPDQASDTAMNVAPLASCAHLHELDVETAGTVLGLQSVLSACHGLKKLKLSAYQVAQERALRSASLQVGALKHMRWSTPASSD